MELLTLMMENLGYHTGIHEISVFHWLMVPHFETIHSSGYCVLGCTEYPRFAIKPGVEAPGVSARVRDQDTRSFEYLQRQHPWCHGGRGKAATQWARSCLARRLAASGAAAWPHCACYRASKSVQSQPGSVSDIGSVLVRMSRDW